MVSHVGHLKVVCAPVQLHTCSVLSFKGGLAHLVTTAHPSLSLLFTPCPCVVKGRGGAPMATARMQTLLTHYSPPAPAQVFKIGAVNGALGCLLWAGLGMPVWKLLGWW